MRKKRFISGIATFGIMAGLVLTGCGKSTTSSGNASTDSSGNVTLSVEFQKGNAGDDTYSNWMKDNVKLFEQQHKNVKFNITDNTSSDAYLTKITTELAGGNPPDVFQGWTSGRMKPFVDSGRVLDVTDAYNSDATLKSSFNKVSLDGTTFNGKVYGFPTEMAAEVIYYNKKVFDQNGLQIPKTYDDLLHAIDVLKSKGVTPIVVPNQEPWNGSIPYMFIAQRLGGVQSYKDTVVEHKQSWDSQTYLDAAKKLQELVKLGAFNKNVNSTTTDQAVAQLTSGQAAMYMNGTWMIPNLRKNMGDNVGFFNFPIIDGGKGNKNDIILLPNSALYVSSKTKNKQAAVDFLKFCFSKERQVALAKGGYLIAANIDLPAGTMDPLATGIHQLESDASDFMLPWDVPLGVFMGKELNNATQRLYTGANPSEVLKNLEQLQQSQAQK